MKHNDRILNLGQKMGELLNEYYNRIVEYTKWWEVRNTSLIMIPPSPMQMRLEILEYVRRLVQDERDVIDEAYEILAKHPTNVHKLSSGDKNYDPDVRYAYLVLQDRMKSWEYHITLLCEIPKFQSRKKDE